MKKRRKRIVILIAAVLILGAGVYAAFRMVSGYMLRMVIENQIESMLNDGALPGGDTAPPQNGGSETAPPPAQTASPGNGNGPAAAVSPEEQERIVKQEAKEILDKISEADRAAMVRLIFSKLSASDISYLSGLLSGGLTDAEKAEALKIAGSRYTQEELEQIKAYYNKYIGLVE